MNKVAVTGANGMTGRHMISLLKTKGIKFKAVTRQEWNLSEWKSHDQLDYIFGSVSAVFHFGAMLSNNQLNTDNNQTQKLFDINVRSCLNLAEWAKLRNVPIIFLSGAVVYENPYSTKINENNSKVVNGFGGFYGYSKLLAENIFNHISLDGLKCIILRPSSIYGYGLLSGKLVQNYLDIASSNDLIKVKGSRNKINFIHAYDVANAAFQAFNKKTWGTFNISSKESNTILEVAEIAVSIFKNGKIEICDDNKNESEFSRFDLNSELAKKNFGFEPLINLKEGMLLMKNKMFIPIK